MSTAPYYSRPSSSATEGRFTLLESYGPALGRLLMSVIFIVSGITKIVNFSGMVAFARNQNLPLPSVAIEIAMIVEISGGVMILLGYKTRIAALILFVFLIPTTLLFHNFWAYEGQMFQMQLVNFMKNLAIMGGLMLLASFGAGRCCRMDRTE
jgi:putative oxidoreductase